MYLVPDFHNPTGRLLDGARRREVARLAAEFHVPVMEDTVQAELWFDAPPPAPIAAFDLAAPILTVGSMSKVFWGGLRIGWVRADEATIARLGRLKAVTDFGTPVLAQLVAARLLDELDDVAARRRDELTLRLGVLTAALERWLPDWTFEPPLGGLSLWTQLPEPESAQLARVAVEHGVTVVPGSTFTMGEQRHADRVRLPFVAPPDVLEEGVRRLATAWRHVRDRGEAPRRQAQVV